VLVDLDVDVLLGQAGQFDPYYEGRRFYDRFADRRALGEMTWRDILRAPRSQSLIAVRLIPGYACAAVGIACPTLRRNVPVVLRAG
jgi:hypothetical protein